MTKATIIIAGTAILDILFNIIFYVFNSPSNEVFGSIAVIILTLISIILFGIIATIFFNILFGSKNKCLFYKY